MKEKHDWEKEWVGMPDFEQKPREDEPFAKISVRFESQEDLEEFSRLIGQKLTPKTKSIWHPYKPHQKEAPRLEWVSKKE